MAKQQAEDPEQNDLFKGVSFYLVDDQNDQVKALLTAGGATREYYVSDLVTHVVANSTDFQEYTDAKEYSLTLVTPRWVVMSSKLNELLPLAAFSPESDRLFSGVVVCPSQIPPEDRSALWAMLTYYGGKCQLNLNSNCTHLVLPNTTGAKYECALKHQDVLKIVTPGWVTDSVKNKGKLDEADYIPCEEANDNTDSILTPDSNGRTTSISTSLTGKQDVISSVVASTLVSSQMSMVTLPSALMSPISPAVTTCVASASIPTVVSVDNKTGQATETLLGEYKHEAIAANAKVKETKVEEMKVEETPKQVGQTVNNEQELPASIQGHDGLNDNKENRTQGSTAICIKETESIDKDETVIVSTKCLTDCVFVLSDYQECMDHSVLDTWIQVIEQHGGSVTPFYSGRCTHLLCLHQCGPLFKKALKDGKQIVTAHWLNDVLTEEKLIPPSNPLHLPVPFKERIEECKDMVICVTGFTGAQRQLLKNMIFIIGAKYTGFLARSNTHLICKSATGEKFTKAKEWGVTSVNAKWLGDTLTAGRPMCCSLVKYIVLGDPSDLDISWELVTDLLVPWQVDIEKLKQQPENSRKRCLEASPENGQPIKSRRICSPSTVEDKSGAPRVLFTGLSPPEVLRLSQFSVELGGTVAQKAIECTHLVCSKILRTVKFLSAISVCQYVVNTDWLEESYKQKTFLDPKRFTVTEVTNIIQMNGVDIEHVLQKANTKPLLEGMRIYVTQSVQPSSSAMREIIECAGGQVLTSVPPSSALAAFKARENERGLPMLIVISCDKDLALCGEFLKRGFIIYNSELILSGVLKQELNFGSHILKRPGS